jgi:hypothetical protein
VFAFVKENLSGAKRRGLPLAGKGVREKAAGRAPKVNGQWLYKTPDRDWKE